MTIREVPRIQIWFLVGLYWLAVALAIATLIHPTFQSRRSAIALLLASVAVAIQSPEFYFRRDPGRFLGNTVRELHRNIPAGRGPQSWRASLALLFMVLSAAVLLW